MRNSRPTTPDNQFNNHINLDLPDHIDPTSFYKILPFILTDDDYLELFVRYFIGSMLYCLNKFSLNTSETDVFDLIEKYEQLANGISIIIPKICSVPEFFIDSNVWLPMLLNPQTK